MPTTMGYSIEDITGDTTGIDEYKCSICMDIVMDAVEPILKNDTKNNCGHIFCRKCFIKSIKSSKRCPLDREKLQRPYYHRNMYVERMIGRYHIRCQYHGDGCKWVGPIKQLPNHNKTHIISCDMCHKSGTHASLQNHKCLKDMKCHVCKNRVLRCCSICRMNASSICDVLIFSHSDSACHAHCLSRYMDKNNLDFLLIK